MGYYEQQLVEVRREAGKGRAAEGCQTNVCCCRRQPPTPEACNHGTPLDLFSCPPFSASPLQIDGTRSMDEVFASIQAAIDAAARAVAA